MVSRLEQRAGAIVPCNFRGALKRSGPKLQQDRSSTWLAREHCVPALLLSVPLLTPSFYAVTRWTKQTPLSIEYYPTLEGHPTRMEADRGARLALMRQDMEPIG